MRGGRSLSPLFLRPSLAHYILFPRRRPTKVSLLSLREEANAAIRTLLCSFCEGCGSRVYSTCLSSQPLFISLPSLPLPSDGGEGWDAGKWAAAGV